MIGQVNVIKGPISALYGDQNRAGSVDIKTAEVANTRSSIGAEVSSFNGKRGNVILANNFNDLESLFVADIYRTEGFRDSTETKRNNYFWKLSKVIGDGRYSARISNYDSKSQAAGYLYLSQLQSGLSPKSTQEDVAGFGEARRNSIVFNRAPAEGEAGWYVTAYFEDLYRTRGITLETNPKSTSHNFGEDDRKMYGLRLSNNFVFDRANLIVGTEVRRDDGTALRQKYINYIPTSDFFYNFDMDLTTYGVFAQVQYQIFDQLKAVGGIRYDRFDYDIQNLKFPDADISNYQSGITTPKFGLVWSPYDNLEIFANTAEGFRSPAAEQISAGASSAKPLNSAGGGANADLKASKVKSYDFGANFQPIENLRTSIELYYIENQNETIAKGDFYEQAGDTTRKGFDLSTAYQLNDQWSVYASYGHIVQAKLDNPSAGSGAKLTVPEHTLKAGVQYQKQLGSGKITLNADAYHLSNIPYYNKINNLPVERKMPAYSRYDLKVAYDYSDYQFSVFATFQPHRYGTEIAYGTNTDLLLSPQPSSILGASVRYFF